MTYKDVTLVSVNGKSPRIHPSAFIAPGCRIIGDVVIGEDVSIWYNCVLRADVSQIIVGARSNIQDGSVIHCDGPMPSRPQGYPTIIGEDVLIGHMAMVHGCELADRAFVGLKATVMNGCTIGSDAMLAAGALLTENKHIPSRELWAGSPARRVRDIDDAQAAGMQVGVAHYVLNGRMHKAAIDG
ncbi:gamma carbonic anhydrase family protein [Sphingopyxis yananensis]|uniref:gamma carbonic anhydrase family protein n=1 Tax=Sphingopyxis yananensis TaxID=2886687 RepID=UPI001D116CB8|nr:gamma carbonic anhydrase family protein [Sphingopyxis yananensis]MCC2602898.1 gamma carbonic anhydrase family protein [Sphingopyxis yananensis]